MRFMKKLASRGNLTLPRDIREAMGIDEGDIIEFQVVGVVRRQGVAGDHLQPTDSMTLGVDITETST